MNINTSELFVLAIPFMGTTLGAAMVFLLKDNIAPKLEKLLLGFASGVMIAASVWSLLIPSIDMQKARNGVAWLPALVGFLVGIAFLLLLDTMSRSGKEDYEVFITSAVCSTLEGHTHKKMQIGGAYAGGNNTKNDCPCNQDIQTDRKCSPEGNEDVSGASEA